MRVAVALFLGICSFFLMFLLGEGLAHVGGTGAADVVRSALFISGMGGYFVISMYLLARGEGRVHARWTMLALNAVLPTAALVALLVEPNKVAALLAVGTALLGLIGSWVGVYLAGRWGGAPSSHAPSSSHAAPRAAR